MASNDELLEALRENTSRVLRNQVAGEVDEALVARVCKDFIALDISLLDGGSAPGGWGASKLSKSKM